MGNELYSCLKNIKIDKLDEVDKSELLNIFLITKESRIRNHIAFIFSDLGYDEAVPFVLKKIKEKVLYNNNGSLVYSLKNLETKDYFIEFVKLVCTQAYEARLSAYEILKKDFDKISLTVKKRSFNFIKKYYKENKSTLNSEKGEKYLMIKQVITLLGSVT